MRIQSLITFNRAHHPVNPNPFKYSNHKSKQEVYKMKGPLNKPTVKLISQNGNAFSIMGLVKKALKHAGADKEYIDKYLNEATSGDYDHFLVVSMEYVNVE
jgi:hypothetical protein